MIGQTLKLVAPLLMASLVAACGGGGSPTTTPIPDVPDDPDVPDTNGVPEGTPLNEPVDAPIAGAFSNGQILLDSTEVVWKDFNTISVGGEDYIYDPQTDRFVFANDPEVYLTLLGNGEHVRIALVTNESGGTLNVQGATLIGDVTETGQMPTDATASYTGGLTMWVTVNGEDGFASHIGSAEINADFGAQTVDGAFSFDGKDIAMGTTAIQDNGFIGAGTLSSETADYAIDGSLAAGTFYGDAAQEVGGAIGFSYTDSTSGSDVEGTAAGVFVGSQ